jgi:proline iminopeptidase
VAWESSTNRLSLDKNSQSQPSQKYALTAARILIHYMINGGLLGATGEANRDNNYILDHVDRLRNFPIHIVHGRYDRVCHLYQAEALVRALRGAGNSEVHYFWAQQPGARNRLQTARYHGRSAAGRCLTVAAAPPDAH